MKKEFLEKLSKFYSKDDLEICKKGFSIEKRKTSFRVNTLKTNNEEVEKILKEKNIKFKKVNFLSNWYYLEEWNEKSLWDLDIFKNGYIYLQSISSQLPIEILDITENQTLLDITAAPGWKTSQAIAKWNNNIKVVANDNNAIRIDKLNFTLERQWCINYEIVKNDARNIVKNNPDYQCFFDKIIADLPCSAEWKFNTNNEKSYWYWSQEIVKKNYKLQKNILKEIIPALKSWWELIYSTCTISPEENEEIAHFILSNFPELEIQDINIKSEKIRPGLKNFNWKSYRKDVVKSIRVLPTETTEWFFIAKFKKLS